jgi:hypothetical protein
MLLKEPKDPSMYQNTMDTYYSEIFENDKKGAILMGVCRGRISEGLDFSDNAARLVIIVGIPYPNMSDAKVVLKKDYLDRKMKNVNIPIENRQLNGKDWYNQQATRAVNQAIGRVIRHVQDYGAIILCDDRFSWGNNKNGISKWLRGQIQTMNEFDKFFMRLRAFYCQMDAMGFIPKLK